MQQSHGMFDMFVIAKLLVKLLLFAKSVVCVNDSADSLCRSDVHGCPLLATVRFWWPDAAYGTVCHPMSRDVTSDGDCSKGGIVSSNAHCFSESPQDTPLLKIISRITFNCFSVPISYTVDSSGLAVFT